jgi:hypothetical protein
MLAISGAAWDVCISNCTLQRMPPEAAAPDSAAPAQAEGAARRIEDAVHQSRDVFGQAGRFRK